MSDEQRAAWHISDLLEQARAIWGPRPVGHDSTGNIPGVVVRLLVTAGDLARLARRFGSVHWEEIQGELPARIDARNELKKELGNVIFSTIRWCDDLGLDVNECIARAIDAQAAFVASGKAR